MNREFTRTKADKTALACRRLVYGVGTNDAWYMIETTAGGETYCCGYYQRWVAMLRRCYSKQMHRKFPTYKDCTVCDEWITFSNFRKWMETQDWQGKELDKDILFPGNKHYSPDNCVFVGRDNFVAVFYGDGNDKW